MLDEQYRQGQVTEQTLTRCGFQADTDWDGTCAGSRPDGGSAEHMQRAKCLTHEHQVRLREEVRERAQAQKQKREADARMKAQNLVLLNQQCELEGCGNIFNAHVFLPSILVMWTRKPAAIYNRNRCIETDTEAVQ